MNMPKHSPDSIISPKGQIAVTLFLPVQPEFTINDDAPDPKGCLTMIIKTTEDTEFAICFDGHYEQPLTELGEAITKAGGVRATGNLGIGRSVFGGELAECGHYLEADSIEPWVPGDQAAMTQTEAGVTVEATGKLAKETLIYCLYEQTTSAYAIFTLKHGGGKVLTPEETIEIVYDSDDIGELGVLVRAISEAGGIKAKGALGDSIGCDHRIEATHVEPWSPPDKGPARHE